MLRPAPGRGSANSQLLKPQKAPAAIAACGPVNAHFAVTLEKHPFVLSLPPPGMARVYVISQIQAVLMSHAPTTKIGMDGNWIGANELASYIALDIPAGKHVFCADISGRRIGLLGRLPAMVALAEVNVRPSETYYLWNYSMGAGDSFTLTPTNADQAAMLLESMPESISHRR